MFYRMADHSIILRSLEPEDAKAVFALIDANRSHLRPWLDWVDATTRLGHVRAFCKKTVKLERQGKAVVAAICRSDAICGLVELRQIDPKCGDAELGFWQSEAAQGQGMMTSAAGAMVDYAFDELGLQTIFAACQPENVRSVRVLERSGFTALGDRKKAAVVHGRAVDLAIFQRCKPEK